MDALSIEDAKSLRDLLERTLGRKTELLDELVSYADFWKYCMPLVSANASRRSHQQERERRERHRKLLRGVYRGVRKLRGEIAKVTPDRRRHFRLDDLDGSLTSAEKALGRLFVPARRGPKQTTFYEACGAVAQLLEKHGVKPTKGRDGKLARTLSVLLGIVGEEPPLT